MLFNSYTFLLFFPIVCIIYFCIPDRFKWVWLLLSSYYFYMSWNPLYILLILTSTVITYTCGRLISYENLKASGPNRKLMWLIISFFINFSILIFFKYFYFIFDNIAIICSALGLSLKKPELDILLPVGISFYTFQAIGYTIDVYRGDITAEKNLSKYALFVSFFPQLVAGPIERTKNLLPQFYQSTKFSYENMRRGLLIMLWGYFLKMVLADRAAILADTIFSDIGAYNGFQLLIGAIAFSIQIFGDFCGYSTIAVGAALIMGFRLTNNFRQPYFAVSIKDFWHRWHITLSTWFRDYLYFPLGGNRCSRPRKYFNLMATFIVSGLWHGAQWPFVFWGTLHGLYQVLGDLSIPLRARIISILKINKETFSYLLFTRLTSFILVLTGWIFFRSATVTEGLAYVWKIIGDFNFFYSFDGRLTKMGLDGVELTVLILAIFIMLLGEKIQSVCSFTEWLTKQGLVFRWLFYYAAIFSILIFGVYGPDYSKIDFIYFQF